jgi:unsaturated rhamnogalacturonyl hydrolase
MALVDILDYLPTHHPGYDTVAGILLRAMDGLLSVQDPATGLWRQVLDQGNRPGNYLEASGACMIVYAMAKGVRTGRLPGCWSDTARLSYGQIVDHFVRVDDRGETHLHGTCGMAGLGGDPYRDGSYEYYIGEPVVTDEPKGVAAFILASVEMEASKLADPRGTGRGFVQGAE